MIDLLIVVCNWLHTLATVVLVGHYCLLALVYWPLVAGPGGAGLLPSVAERARPYLSAAVLVFIATGTYLMLMDDQYLGLGAIGNTWSWLLIIKHVLVLALIALAIYADRTLAPLAAADPAARSRYRLMLLAWLVGGVGVLLMTAIMQTA
jgi:uncharacterized membrane protein